MLPRARRLPRERFRELPQKLTGRGFVVKYAPNGERVSRHAVVIGAKIHKLSVKRHRVKRIILEEASALGGGIDCVWVCNPSIKELDAGTLHQAARDAVVRIERDIH